VAASSPAPRANRDAHERRGFRRSKQRRRAVDRAFGLAQTRLFRTGEAG
jgi:hypothetical protein